MIKERENINEADVLTSHAEKRLQEVSKRMTAVCENDYVGTKLETLVP